MGGRRANRRRILAQFRTACANCGLLSRIIKAALTNNAAIDGKNLTFNVEERRSNYLNDQNLVERIQYLITNEVVGDLPVEFTCSIMPIWRRQVPAHRQNQDGHPTLDLTIREVKPNAAVTLEVPATSRQGSTTGNASVKVDKLAEGVWYLNAAGVSSWAVEFKDHVVMVEGPFGEARSLAVNEAVRKAVPNKPIKYVVNTHAH
jgi:hypothetical protein